MELLSKYTPILFSHGYEIVWFKEEPIIFHAVLSL